MSQYPTTEDTPEEVAILPDWSIGINVGIQYKTSDIKALSGYSQTVRHWARGRNTVQYKRNTTGAENNESISFNRTSQAFKPLRFPLWGHATASRIPQSNTNLIEAEIGIPDIIIPGSRIFIYDHVLGGTWRTVTDVQDLGRKLFLEDLPGAPAYPLQSWIFPTAVGTLSITDNARELTQTRASVETLIFAEL